MMMSLIYCNTAFVLNVVCVHNNVYCDRLISIILFNLHVYVASDFKCARRY